jgi:hypothetical protein
MISRAELSSEDISSSFNFNVTQLEQQVFTMDIVSLTKTVDTVETECSVFAILDCQKGDARCTHGIKSRIPMAKAASKKKKTLSPANWTST